MQKTAKPIVSFPDSFFSLSWDLLVVADLDGYFKIVNPAWTRTLGWTERELTARPYLDFVHPDDRASTMVAAAKLNLREIVVEFENRYRCKDGSYRHLEWTARTDTNNSIVYAAARDKTAQFQEEQKRKAAEGELRSYAERLARSNADLEQLAYVASHDMQEPLRTIMSHMQMLELRIADRLTPETREFLDFAISGAERLRNLIEDLLSYSRVGHDGLPAEPVEMGAVVGGVLASLQRKIDDTRARIEVGPLPTVTGNAVALSILFQNLVENAIKYRAKGRPIEIRISAERSRDSWTFSVKDNGIGMSSQDTTRVFGMFKRLHAHSEIPGTGIGLATCDKIVRLLGGSIRAVSELGVGSEFVFTLPTGN